MRLLRVPLLLLAALLSCSGPGLDGSLAFCEHLLEHANVFKGVVARPEIHERRKSGRPWWHRPFG